MKEDLRELMFNCYNPSYFCVQTLVRMLAQFRFG